MINIDNIVQIVILNYKIIKFMKEKQITIQFNKLPQNQSISLDKLKFNKTKINKIPFKMVKSKFEPDQQILQIPHPIIVQSQFDNQYYNEQQIIKPQKINSNIAFISMLIHISDYTLYKYEQAQIINIYKEEIYVIMTGQLKFICKNQKQFVMNQGFIFFLSTTFSDKIKSVVTHKRCSIIKISRNLFQKNVLKPLSMKNYQKIYILKKCKYFSKLDDSFLQDLSTSIQLVQFNKGVTIYQNLTSQIDYIYFVKQGIVLLQRSESIKNKNFIFYQRTFEMSAINQNDNTLVVRKFMCFGLDGSIINNSKKRFYSAKTLSNCDIYRLKSSLINAVYDEEYLPSNNQQKYLIPINDNSKNDKDDLVSIKSKFLITNSFKKFQLPFNHHNRIDQLKKKNILEIQNLQNRVRKSKNSQGDYHRIKLMLRKNLKPLIKLNKNIKLRKLIWSRNYLHKNMTIICQEFQKSRAKQSEETNWINIVNLCKIIMSSIISWDSIQNLIEILKIHMKILRKINKQTQLINDLYYLFINILKNIMSSTSKVQYLYEIQEKSKIEKPIKLIHPANLDNEYKQIQKKHEISKEQLKQFESCPYYAIRQLVTCFLSIKVHNFHSECSDLLNQKYQFNKEAKNLDYKLEFDLKHYRKQKKCHEKLERVLKYYNQQIKNVRYNMNKCIEQQNTYRGGSDEQFLQNFDTKFRVFQDINIKAKQAETNYFNLLSFSQFFSNACIMITANKQPNNQYPIKNMAKYLEDVIEYRINLETLIKNTDKKRFENRQKIKFSNDQVIDTIPSQYAEIVQHYAMLVKFPNVIRKQLDQLRPIYQKFTNSYASYLKKYADYEQMNVIRKNSEQYNHLINKQKNNFTNHLKLHHQLMVNYFPSNQFISLNKIVEQKRYAAILYSSKLQEINNAIKFVNVDYGRMFKKICNSEQSVKRQIAEYVQKFQKTTTDKYNIIILNALAKLEQLSFS